MCISILKVVVHCNRTEIGRTLDEVVSVRDDVAVDISESREIDHHERQRRAEYPVCQVVDFAGPVCLRDGKRGCDTMTDKYTHIIRGEGDALETH